ncbi:hypothetical protein WJ17_17335 [Burkholderia vietnamiensis]|nr:hypothetical protein WJ17_17335 [Burkholderia vietnamiensis]
MAASRTKAPNREIGSTIKIFLQEVVQIMEILMTYNTPIVICMHPFESARVILNETFMLRLVHQSIPCVVCTRARSEPTEPTSNALSDESQFS